MSPVKCHNSDKTITTQVDCMSLLTSPVPWVLWKGISYCPGEAEERPSARSSAGSAASGALAAPLAADTEVCDEDEVSGINIILSISFNKKSLIEKCPGILLTEGKRK